MSNHIEPTADANRFRVRLVDGKLYDPWSPSGPVPEPETVAYGLARLCRYGGHVRRSYSVAEHSIWIALNLACGGHDNEAFEKAAYGIMNAHTEAFFVTPPDRAQLALFGLIHDAPEGCGLVDVPGPVLRHEEMKAYKQAHDCCIAWLCDGWGIPKPPWPKEVKETDISILGAEMNIRPFVYDAEEPGSGEDLQEWPRIDLAEKSCLWDPLYTGATWLNAFKVLKHIINGGASDSFVAEET